MACTSHSPRGGEGSPTLFPSSLRGCFTSLFPKTPGDPALGPRASPASGILTPRVWGAGDGPGPFLGWSWGLAPMIPGTGTRWHSRPVAMALAAPAGCRSLAASSCTKLGLSSARGCAAHTKRCWLGSGRGREASLQHAGRRPGLPASFPRLENPPGLRPKFALNLGAVTGTGLRVTRCPCRFAALQLVFPDAAGPRRRAETSGSLLLLAKKQREASRGVIYPARCLPLSSTRWQPGPPVTAPWAELRSPGPQGWVPRCQSCWWWLFSLGWQQDGIWWCLCS